MHNIPDPRVPWREHSGNGQSSSTGQHTCLKSSHRADSGLEKTTAAWAAGTPPFRVMNKYRARLFLLFFFVLTLL